MDGPNREPGARKPDKTKRLAEALRQNLRKRKAQARARSRIGPRIGESGAGISESRPEIDTDSGDER